MTQEERAMKMLSYNGKTQCVSAWARDMGVSTQTLYCRMRRHKGDLSKVFGDPKPQKIYELNGRMYTSAELAKMNGTVGASTISRWIRREHITPEEAINRKSARMNRSLYVSKKKPIGCTEPDCDRCPFPDDCHW